MQTNFGLSDMLFDVETVFVKVGGDEPTEAISVNPIEGSMVGNRFTIGNFRFNGKQYENGDKQLAFDVSFIDVTPDENTQLIIDNQNTISRIANQIIQDAFSEA
jgi:hypothetical protein